MTTRKVNTLTDVGNITTGDKVVGERVDGTTVRITYAVEVSEDTTPQLGGNLDLNGKNINSVTPTEIGYVSGVTSALQTQIDGKSPTAGNASLVTVGTVTTGTWNATPVTVTYGGSGRATATAYAPLVGGTTATGAHQSVATAGSSGQLLVSQGASSIPTWTTPTYPVASATSGKILISDGTNFVPSTPTFPTAASTAGKLVQSDGTNLVMSTPTYPTAASTAGKHIKSDGTNLVMTTATYADTGTSGKLLIGDGTNYVETTSTYPSTTAGNGRILRSNGTNFIETSATYPTTTTVNQILYSSVANGVAGLATANSGVLVTGGTGIPSIATDIPTAVTIGGAYNYRAGGTDIPVADGGTGLSATTAYAVLCGGTTTTGNLQSVASVGTAAQVLTSNGAGALPTFQDLPTASIAASQADQETATSVTTFVSPGRQQFHPSAAKGWCQADVSGGATSSYNVTSVTDGGTGLATINWNVDMSSANHCIVGSAFRTAGAIASHFTALAAGSCTLQCTNIVGPAAIDPNNFMVVAYGDQ